MTPPNPSLPEPVKGRLYVVRKGGYYYRPGSAGYTANVAEAGRYTLEEAIRESHPNGPDGPRDGITYERAPEAEPHDPDTLVDRLLGYTYDWNGSEMADEASALTEVSCGVLREAALRIRAVEAAQLNFVRRGQHFKNGGIERAAALVEELSKRPGTRWGEIVTAIRALKEEPFHD